MDGKYCLGGMRVFASRMGRVLGNRELRVGERTLNFSPRSAICKLCDLRYLT